MSPEPELLTLGDIARLAGGVTVPAVANWRKRFDDFPVPRATEGRTPLFEKTEVLEWLRKKNKLAPEADRANLALWQFIDGARGPEFSWESLLDLLDPAAPIEGDAEYRTASTEVRDLWVKLAELDGHRHALESALGRITRSAGRQFATHDVHPGVFELFGTLSATPPGATVYDPCVGLGRTLEAVCVPDSRLFGQETNPTLAKISSRLLKFAGNDPEIATGDVIDDDRFPNLLADRVVSSLSAGQLPRRQGFDASDPRWVTGTRGLAVGDSAFVQVALAHLAPGGRAILQVTPNTLFQRRNDLREYIVRNNLLDAIMMLPRGLVGGANTRTCLLVIDRNRPPSSAAEQTPILMVDAERSGETNGMSDTLLDELKKLWASWNRAPLEHELAQTVTLTELVANDFDLSPSRYLQVAEFDWPRNRSASASNSDDQVERELVEVDQQLSSTLASIPPVRSTPLELAGSSRLRELRELRQLLTIRGTARPLRQASGKVLTPSDIARRELTWGFEQPPVGDDVDSPNAVLGDILVSLVRTGDSDDPRVGRVGIDWVGREVSRDILILRLPNFELPELTAEYLMFWLASPAFTHHLAIHARGASENVSRKDVMGFVVPIAGLDDQLALVRAMHDKAAAGAELTRHFEGALTLIERQQHLFVEQAAGRILRNAQ